MPRIISIARSSPTLSSVVRCWDTSAGGADLAVSVAMRAFSLSSVSVRRPGSPGRACRRARDLRGGRGLTVGNERTTWAVRLDGDHGRVRLVAAPALADARRVAVARVRGADRGRRRADRPAALP